MFSLIAHAPNANGTFDLWRAPSFPVAGARVLPACGVPLDPSRRVHDTATYPAAGLSTGSRTVLPSRHRCLPRALRQLQRDQCPGGHRMCHARLLRLNRPTSASSLGDSVSGSTQNGISSIPRKHGTGVAAASRSLYGSRISIGVELLQILSTAPSLHLDGSTATSEQRSCARAPGIPSSSATPLDTTTTSHSAATGSGSAGSASACVVPPRGPAIGLTGAAGAAGAVSDALGAPGGYNEAAVAAPALLEVAALVREVSALMAAHRDMAGLRAAMGKCAQRTNELRAAGPVGAGSSGSHSGRGAERAVQPVFAAPAAQNAAQHARAGLPLGPAQPEWDWAGVKRLVVVGLGSLASYQEALRSGRQTERESNRAAARLYQLALSRILGSVEVLPGLGTGDPPLLPSPPQLQSAAQPNGTPAYSDPGPDGGGGGAVTAAVADVQYFDPEYLPWDLQLVRALWDADGVDVQPTGAQAADGTRSPGASSGHAGGRTAGETDGRGAAAAELPVQSEVTPGVRALSGIQSSVTPVRPEGPLSGFQSRAAAQATAAAAPAAALVASQPTLFYAPCCPRELYDEIVRQNLAAGTLANVALIGNSLKAQADSALLLRAFGGFMAPPSPTNTAPPNRLGAPAPERVPAGRRERGFPLAAVSGDATGLQGGGEEAFVEMVAEGRVAEMMLPDFGAHGVATSLHLFA